MKICNLSSGSDGNSTFIMSDTTKILVDIGLSCKEMEFRLSKLGVNPQDISAILITHEHSDHIKGLEVFANKYNTRVYVHRDGYFPLMSKIRRKLNYFVYEGTEFRIGDLKIQSIAVPHDVERCSGYVIWENERKISIFTDLGHTTNDILQNIYGSCLVFLEANYDPEKLLHNLNYPPYIKNRILGNNGHLCNKDCANAIIEIYKSGCKQVVLSHLSRENNSPDFALNYIKTYLQDHGIFSGVDIQLNVADIVPTAIFRV